MRRSRPVVALAFVVCALCPAAAPAAPVVVTEGVRYGAARVGAPVPGFAPLLLDLYRSTARIRGPRPAVVLIHGGGFRQGSRSNDAIVQTARALARENVVVASIDYRLLAQEPVPSARVAPLLRGLPDAPISEAVVAAVDDTLTAIDYLRRRAKRLNVDVRRLGVIGSSAGAITANHVGYVLDDHGIRAPKVRFVGSLWGGLLIGASTGDGPRVSQLDRGEPALFAVHGTADATVPVELSDQLVSRARTRRIPTEYHRIADAGHGFIASRFFTAAVTRGETPLERLLRFASTRLR